MNMDEDPFLRMQRRSGVRGINFDWANPATSSPLVSAICALDACRVKRLLAAGCSPNSPDNRGMTPLHIAARTDEAFSILQLLLQNGGYVDHSTHNGVRPICIAAYGGAVKNVSLLLKTGAKINATTHIGASVMHYAANGGSLSVVHWLHAAGEKIDPSDDYGRTPLMLAAKNGFVDVCKYLLDNGALPLSMDETGRTALHEACRSDSVALLDAIIHHIGEDVQATVNTVFPDGWTLPMEAAQYGSTNVLARLFEMGASAEKVNNQGQLALHLATNRSSECFRECLKHTPVEAINRYSFSDAGDIVSLPCLLIDSEDIEGLDALFSLPGVDLAVKTCPVLASSSYGPKSPAEFAMSAENEASTVESIIAVFVKHRVPLEVEGCKLSSDLLLQYHRLHPAEADCRCLAILRQALNCSIMRLNEDEFKANPTLQGLCLGGYTAGLALFIKYSVRFTAFAVLWEFVEHLLISRNNIEREIVATLGFLSSVTQPGCVPHLVQLFFPSGVMSLKAIARDSLRKAMSRKQILMLSDFYVPSTIIDYLDYSDLISNLSSLCHCHTNTFFGL